MVSRKTQQLNIEYYTTKEIKLSGTSLKEIEDHAVQIFRSIKKRTKRTPYIRSKYFNKEKVFLNIFWQHLYQKREKDRVRRLKFFNCAIELIKNSIKNPQTTENFKQKKELLYRFYGCTRNKDKFIVQIKENKRTKRKDLISIYPE